MKKIFGLIAALMLLNGCDDGDMTFETFNFESSPVLCNESQNTYLSINENEVLILKFAVADLLNVEGTKEVQFANGAIEYRIYEGTPTQGKICGLTDDPTITVKEYWTGSGNATITTTRVLSSAGVVSYEHSVTLDDVSLTKGEETIRIQDNYLGVITKSAQINFDFASTTENPTQVRNCSSDINKKFVLRADEALIMQLAAGAFDNALVTGEVKNVTLNTINYLTFYKYSGTGMTEGGICLGNGPITPTEKQRWTALNGTVRIVKTNVDKTFDIYLYNVVFNNNAAGAGAETFSPETNGTDTDSNPYYYLGYFVNP